MSTALTTPQQQQALAAMRAANAKPTVSSMPEIKFKQTDTEVQGLTKGHYYLKTFENEEVKVRDIGPNPEVVILHRAYTYSYYDEQAETLRAWTSDIDRFDDLTYAYLFEKDDKGTVRIIAEGSYPALKKSIKSPKYQVMKGDTVKNLMKFTNVLYVIFEGQVCRMFVSVASSVGIAAGEKSPNFDQPQPLSLEDFVQTTRGIETQGLGEFVCKLGSIYKKDVTQPYYLLTFENIGPNGDLSTATQYYTKLLQDRDQKLQWDLDRIRGNSEPSIPREAAIEAFGQDVSADQGIKVEDLPY